MKATLDYREIENFMYQNTFMSESKGDFKIMPIYWTLIFLLELRNRFETLQEKEEKNTPNDEYENIVNAHLEAASKCIPTKPRTKYRAPWETEEVREKRALV